MADIKDQLIKDSYNYVLQSDLTTGVVYRIGGTIPVNPIFSSGLTINNNFVYSGAGEQNGYVLTTDGSGYAYWSSVTAATPSSGVTSITVGNGLSANSTTGAVTIVFTGSTSTSGDYLPLSGGTVYGNTFYTSGLTANTLTVTGLTNTSGITSTGGIIFPQKTISSTYTATTSDYTIDVSGGTFTVYLPSAVGIQGRLLNIKNNGGGAVTVQPYGSEKIDDKSFIILGETNAIQIASNGSNWLTLGYNITTVNSSTGVFEFTGMSKVSSTQFSVAPVRGWIIDDTTNPLSPQLYYVYYSGGTHTDSYVNTSNETFVYLTSGGTIAQSSIPLTEQQRRQNIFLGKIGHPDKTTINLVFSQPDYVLSPLAQLRDMFVPINLINGGVYPSPNGANLNFNTSAGYLYGLGINFSVSTISPNTIYVPGQSPVTFQYRTQTGGTITNVTAIDPTKWDVGGTITNITGTKATNQRIFLLQNGTFRVQYGQTQYNQLSAAIAGIQTETFVTFPNFTNNAILIGILSVLSTATDLSDTSKAQFFFMSKFGETVGAAGGIGTTTLQQAYNNSSEPEITINSTLDGLSIKNGTGNADNTTALIQGLNSSGVITSFVRADGLFSGSSVSTPGFTANTDGLTATTISATTYYNLPTDIRTTGVTYSDNTFIFTNNTGGTYSVLFNTITGLTINGNLSVTGTTSSGTISATTYQNLPFSGTVTGGGTTNYVPKWTGSTGLGNSQIFDDGTNVGIGTTSPSAKLDVNSSVGGTMGVRISGDSSSDMLRITQTGSGNAILVEDSSNPDSTPFVVTSGGTVGIGTTSPSYFLEATSTGGVDAVMLFDGGTAANANLVARADTTQKLPVVVMSDRNNAYGVNTSFYIGLDRSPSSQYAGRNDAIYVNNYTDKGHHFVTNNGGSKGVRMSILGNGDVGIGTTSPSAKLDVISPTSGSTPILRVSGASSVEAVRITQTGGGFALVVEDDTNPDSTSFVVDSAGRVGIGYGTGTTLGQALTINGIGTAATSFIAPTLQGTTLYPQNDVNLNIRTRDGGAGNRDILFGTGNGGGTPFTRMTIASTGNVGIGTTSPSARLDVSGDTLLRSGVTLSNLSSSANTRFIVSDSNGVLSYRTDVLTGTTITITGGTNIEIVGSYPNFGVSFTGTTGSNFTGGTVTGATNFTNGLTANTFSATTYFNLPVSGLTSGTNIGLTNNNGNYTISFTGGTILKYYTSGSTPTGTINDGDRWFNSTDGVELVYITDTNGSQWIQPNNGGTNSGSTSISGNYLPISGGTVTGNTVFQSGLTANTLTTFNSGFTHNNSIGVDRYSGEIVKFGAGNTSASTLYYYSSGNWSLTDANSTTTSTKMLGIGISPNYTTSGNPSTDGILVRGYARLYYPGTWNDGDILYVADNNLGLITNIAPTTSTYVVRIIGYVVDGASNLIYFCPDNTWIELV